MGGVLADQWKEFFYCDSMAEDVLAVKGQKRVSGRSSNKKGNDNIISSGSVIAVADGQCMLIVEQGKIVEVCAEPGEFTFDASTEPTIFSGDLGDSISQVFGVMGKRFTFGGEAPKDQRVYYFNTKELLGNKYGTPSSIPFHVEDRMAGYSLDIHLRCFGEYSFRIMNPLQFYGSISGNIPDVYTKDVLTGQMRSELLDALQPALGQLSERNIRYSAITTHIREIKDILKEELKDIWGGRGIEIVNFSIDSLKADEEDEKQLFEMQREVTYRNTTNMAAHLGHAQAEAMKAAAANENAGPAMAFMGMNMAGQAGGDLGALYRQGMEQDAARAAQMQQMQAQAPAGWTCSCGKEGNTGKFCAECGAPKPAPKASWKCKCGHIATGNFCTECGAPKPADTPEGWVCSCGAVNKGKFCSECGAKKPAGVPQYKCDKCGWEPEDPTHPPKFCPECGDPFDDGDIL